jgi:hypothetical protein
MCLLAEAPLTIESSLDERWRDGKLSRMRERGRMRSEVKMSAGLSTVGEGPLFLATVNKVGRGGNELLGEQILISALLSQTSSHHTMLFIRNRSDLVILTILLIVDVGSRLVRLWDADIR